MKATAAGKVIIYDDACPLCRAYTAGFVSMGILDEFGRVGFAHADTRDIATLDTDRARHVIPLLDRASGEVVYGLDALFLLLGGRFPGFRSFLGDRLKRALLPLYQFISYNRRVIAGCAPATGVQSGFDCAPDFHRRWRVTHLVLCAIGWIASVTHTVWETRHYTNGYPFGILALLILLHVALIVTAMTAYRQRSPWDTIGNLATNALMFGLLIDAATGYTRSARLLTAVFAAAGAITAFDAWRRLRAPAGVTV